MFGAGVPSGLIRWTWKPPRTSTSSPAWIWPIIPCAESSGSVIARWIFASLLLIAPGEVSPNEAAVSCWPG